MRLKSLKQSLIAFSVTLFCMFSFFNNSFAQGEGGFERADHTFEINGNEITVFLLAEFNVGGGYLDSIYVSLDGYTLYLDVHYNSTRGGIFTYYFLEDTISYSPLPNGMDTIVVNSFVHYNSRTVAGEIDTAQVDSDTSYVFVSSIFENDIEEVGVDVFPNPATSVLKIKNSNQIEFRQIRLVDGVGKELARFNGHETQLPVGKHKGLLYLIFETVSGKFYQREVLIE